MRWAVFAIVAYVMLSMQIGLRPLLGMGVGDVGVVSPSMMLILLVYVGLMAPEREVGWTALVLGLLVDLVTPLGVEGGVGRDVVIIGPGALGYLVGGYAMVQMRGYVFKKSVLSLAAMVFMVGIFVELVTVALLTARGWGWLTGEAISGWAAADQLVRSFCEVLYTVVVSIAVGWLLIRSERLWGFVSMAGRGGGAAQYGQRR